MNPLALLAAHMRTPIVVLVHRCASLPDEVTDRGFGLLSEAAVFYLQACELRDEDLLAVSLGLVVGAKRALGFTLPEEIN